MSNLKEIRTRINSVSSTRKITSAMKMVSAAKYHKAQETIARFEPYSQRLLAVLAQTFLSEIQEAERFWFKQPEATKPEMLIVITSNSSMCAGFNQNLIKATLDQGPSIFPHSWGTERLSIICLGKKGADILTKRGINIASTDSALVEKPHFNLSFSMADTLLASYSKQAVGRVMVAYNHFRNPAVQVPTIAQYLPILLPKDETKQPVVVHPDTIFEPSKEHITKVLIPKTMRNLFHGYILQNAVGEHGARMTAMHQATDNATELLSNLVLQYNKARQAAITKEILEIISGAEALKG